MKAFHYLTIAVVLGLVGVGAFYAKHSDVWPSQLMAEPLNLAASPQQVAFPTLPLGQLAKASVLLTNVGNESIEIKTIETDAPFNAANPPLGVFLEPGATHFVNVEFRPLSHGSNAGTLRVVSKSGDHFEVSLSGTGAAPADLKIEPRAIAFGDVAVGTTATALLTLENLSEAEYTIPKGALASDFSLDTESIPLSGGERRTIKLHFTPSGVGERHDELLLRDESDQEDLARVAISGRGVESPLDISFSASPQRLEFGEVPVGSAREGWLTLRNTGLDELTLVSVSLPPGFAAPAGSRKIAGGRELSFPVTFKPEETRSYSGRAVFSTNVPEGDPLAIYLDATGTGKSAQNSRSSDTTSRSGSSDERSDRFSFWDRTPQQTSDFNPGAESSDLAILEPVGEVPEFADPDAVDGPAVSPIGSLDEGSSIELIGYQQDVGQAHVGEIVIDRNTGEVQLSELALPKVRGPFHEWWQILPTDAVGSVNSLGDIEVSIPVEIIGHNGLTTRTEIKLTSGVSELRDEGTIYQMTGTPIGNDGDASLVSVTKIPEGYLTGGILKVNFNVRVD